MAPKRRSETVQPSYPEGHEEWRAIPDLEFYEASNKGRIRSLDRTLDLVGRWGPMRRFHRGMILRLKPKSNGCGAIYWSFYAGEDGGYWQVNRAVCLAFHGRPPSPKHEAAHLDGNTDNNQTDNLTWATPVENAAHKVKHGTASVGEKNGAAKLTPTVIRQIFSAYCDGTSTKTIAAEHGVTCGNITGILGGKTWAHIDVGELRSKAAERAQFNLRETWRLAARRRQSRGPSLQEQVQ